MVSEFRPLRFELQSRLPRAPKQTNGASSLEIQTGNFAKSVSLKFDIQMQTFLNWDFKIIFNAFIFEWKNLNLLELWEQLYICKMGKIQSELKLLVGVY